MVGGSDPAASSGLAQSRCPKCENAAPLFPSAATAGIQRDSSRHLRWHGQGSALPREEGSPGHLTDPLVANRRNARPMATRFHDHRLAGYVVGEFGKRITLNLEYHPPGVPRQVSAIEFSEVAAYQFIHTGSAILADIREVPLADLLRDIGGSLAECWRARDTGRGISPLPSVSRASSLRRGSRLARRTRPRPPRPRPRRRPREPNRASPRCIESWREKSWPPSSLFLEGSSRAGWGGRNRCR